MTYKHLCLFRSEILSISIYTILRSFIQHKIVVFHWIEQLAQKETKIGQLEQENVILHYMIDGVDERHDEGQKVVIRKLGKHDR